MSSFDNFFLCHVLAPEMAELFCATLALCLML